MSDQILQADYEQLTAIAQRFAQQSESTTQLSQHVRQRMNRLQQTWLGLGSQAFFAEMQDEVMPAVTRLTQALSEAQKATQQIAQLIRQAEEEAAGLFKGEGQGANAGGEGAGSGTGGDGSGSQGSGPGGSGGPSASSTPLTPTPVPTDQIFSEDSYDKLVGSQVRGAGSKDLANAMNTLLGNPTDAQRDAALATIARERGLTMEQARANYDKYVQLRAERDAHNGGPADESLFNWQREGILGTGVGRHMASTNQLRYGKMVGDALGVDPVFGAMLNPSGGMPGPGKVSVPVTSTEAIGYHGIVHDAAGYLYNSHGKGPGYNYLGLENRDTANKFTGQQSGIKYWNDKVGQDPITRVGSETVGYGLGIMSDYETGGIKKAAGTIIRDIGGLFGL